jgi:hypothetical protein
LSSIQKDLSWEILNVPTKIQLRVLLLLYPLADVQESAPMTTPPSNLMATSRKKKNSILKLPTKE